MAYVMRCLGFDFGVAYCNLRPPLNNGYYISGTATCPTCGNVVRLGWSGWTWNSWQGACYGALASPLEDTKCYSVQHDYQRKYWEIGNDKNDSQTPPRPGIAFTYAWYDADSGGGSQQFVQAVEGEGECPGGVGHGLYNLDPDPPLVGN